MALNLKIKRCHKGARTMKRITLCRMTINRSIMYKKNDTHYYTDVRIKITTIMIIRMTIGIMTISRMTVGRMSICRIRIGAMTLIK
jgi:hypothetical protein